MADETSVYPGTIDSWTNKEAKKDPASKSDFNKLQNAMLNVQTELGTNPAGSVADLKTRLAVSIADDGAVQKGTSFPGSPTAMQLFARTDEDKLYRRNAANDAWIELPTSGQSTHQFSFCGHDAGGNAGFYVGTTIGGPGASGYYAFWRVQDTTYRTTIPVFKWVKIPGVDTITIYARIWSSAATSNDADLKVDIGGQNNNVTATGTTPQAVTFTIDVSGLSDGTAYDVTIQLKSPNNNICCMSSIVAYGS
ncbi:MAG: hypothetical protein [Siphoviridae sp. ctCJE6]|nr:MAG: hypothetical protein [Siphoviridae sp. ctCJE6]